MKRILSVLLSLVLCLGLFPPMALAAEANPTLNVSKGRIFLSELNGAKRYAQVYRDQITTYADDWKQYTGRMTITGSSGSAYASIDVQSGEHDIVLRDVTLRATRDDKDGFSGLRLASDNSLQVNLTLEGNNVIQGSPRLSDTKTSLPGINVRSGSRLIIGGSGTLRAVGGNTMTTTNGIANEGICVEGGSLTIQDGVTVTAVGGNEGVTTGASRGNAIYIGSGASLTVDNSRLVLNGFRSVTGDGNFTLKGTNSTLNATLAYDINDSISCNLQPDSSEYYGVFNGRTKLNAGPATLSFKRNGSFHFSKETYSLSQDGTSKGSLQPGTEVQLIAGSAPEGTDFLCWELVSGEGSFEDATQENTTFTTGWQDTVVRPVFGKGSTYRDFVVQLMDGATEPSLGNDNRLIISGNGTYSISMVGGKTSTEQCIKITGGSPTIILNNVKIHNTGNEGGVCNSSPIDIFDKAQNVEIKLKGENELSYNGGTSYKPGLSVDGSSKLARSLSITSLAGDGSTQGKLTVSSRRSCGIGYYGNKHPLNIFIKGGTLDVNGKNTSPPAIISHGSDGGKLEITGGDITINGEQKALPNKTTISGGATITYKGAYIDKAQAGGKWPLHIYYDSTTGSSVESLEVMPQSATLICGESLNFTAQIDAGERANPAITWSVEGADSGTSIDSNGRLTVSGSQTPGTLTVKVTDSYSGRTVTAQVTVTKEPPEVSQWPTAGEIAYGQALSEAVLTGGSANTPGSFAWTDSTQKPGVGTGSFEVTFQPEDTTIPAVTGQVSVTVNPAMPFVTWTEVNQTRVYTGRPAEITPPDVELRNDETYSGDIAYSHTVGDSEDSTDGLPVDVGEYWVKASVPANGNYTEAQSGVMQLTIVKATPPAPAAPTAEVVTDSSVTLTAVENAQYKRDDGGWQDSPVFSGLAPNHTYSFYVRLKEDGNHLESPESAAARITTQKPSLSGARVTISGTYTYTGAAIVPSASEVKVMLNGKEVDSDQYAISTSNNINAGVGAATLTVTAKADSDYSGSVSSTFTINWADLTVKAKNQTITYGQSIAQGTGQVTSEGLCGGDTLESITLEASSDQVAAEGKTVTPSGAVIKNGGVDVTANYNITYQAGALTINKNTSAAPPKANEGYTLDYAGETITVKPGYEVHTAQTDGTAVTGSITAHLGKALYIRKVEDSNHAASDWTAFKLADRPAAPSLTKTDETLKGQKDGKIADVTTAMEYSIDNGAAWTDCTGTEITGLGPCTAMVRVKATETVPHGETSKVTVAEGKPITVSFDSQGGSAVQEQAGLSYGSKAEKPEAPTREDYTFLGWYKEPACTIEWVFESDTLTGENVTLYAKWKKVRFTVGGTVKDSDGNAVAGRATVTLMKGSEQIDQGTTQTDGSFTFSQHIEAGAYNIVTTYAPENGSPRIKTTLIVLTDEDMDNVAVTLPPEGVNSQLTVSPGSDTPAVVVGGLDEEAAALKIGDVSTVTVSMAVEGKKESQVEEPVAAAIKDAAKADTGGGEPMVEYLDISVTKQVDETKEQLAETKNVIEIVVPFDFTGKENIVVLRYHGDTAEKFTEARDSAKQDKTYKLDKENGYIYIYASKFSTYAVGYTASHTITFDANGGTVTPTEAPTGSNGKLSTLPTPTWDGYTFKGWYTLADGGTVVTADTAFTGSTTIYAHWEKKSSQGGGGGGGGGWYPSVSYYSVKVNKSEHGTVTASPTSASSGSTVTLNAKPDEGYKLDKMTVTDSQNRAVELTEKNGKYTFKMPSRNVTVKADFVPVQTPSPSPEPTGSPSPLPSGSPTPTTSPSPSPKPWRNPFPDVSNTGWYIKAVEFVCKNGLMAGYVNGKFGPNDSMTRAQFAQIIYNKAGRPQAGSGVFSDVTTGWYASAVNWAAAEGIVTGVGGGRFAPDRPITRQDLAVMLWRYAGSPEPHKNELDFKDAGKASTYAWKALCWANENGIVSGKGNGILDPKGKATRAEAAQMLMNYSDK